MDTELATLARQKLDGVTRPQEVLSSTPESKLGKREPVAALWSVANFLLVTALLVWPLIHLLKDSILTSLPILVSCYGAGFSMTRTTGLRWYVVSFALTALGLVLIRIAILQQP